MYEIPLQNKRDRLPFQVNITARGTIRKTLVHTMKVQMFFFFLIYTFKPKGLGFMLLLQVIKMAKYCLLRLIHSSIFITCFIKVGFWWIQGLSQEHRAWGGNI